jgi:quercetin dioxygenase-like cupin family protein
MLAALAVAAQHRGMAAEGQLPSHVYNWNDMLETPRPYGASKPFFSGPTPNLGHFSVSVTRLNPGHAPHSPHEHAEEEVIIIKEGTARINLSGKTRDAPPGTVTYYAPHTHHGIVAESEPVTYYVIRCGGKVKSATR